MPSRITGLASGLDVDAVVKSTMTAYQTKVDTTKQKKEIYEIKQKLYRDVISEGKKLFNNYFDLGKSDSLLASKNYITTTFTPDKDSVVTAKALSGAIKDDYTISNVQIATKANMVIKTDSIDTPAVFGKPGNDALKVTYNGKEVSFNIGNIDPILIGKERYIAMAAIMNEKLGATGMTAVYSDISDGIAIQSSATGELINGNPSKTNNFSVVTGSITPSGVEGVADTFTTSHDLGTSTTGTDLSGKITNSLGTKDFTGASNTQVFDGVQFTFTSNTVTPVKLVGKTDVTASKDKLVKFVNDYNAYIEKLNKLTTDKHDKSYSPLTAEQKKEMSETEIKLWNERVEKGQLSRDGDLIRIVNDLKNAMSASVKGSGITLEKIGITPVDDYTTKNGMFTINEEKLTAALESDPNAIIKLFTSPKPADDTLSNEEKSSMTGIGYRMQEILNGEFMYSSKSALIKKAGYEGTTYFTQSTMSKSITEYERKITDMEKTLKVKEQALYSKYANLETMMNKYNTQMSYLNAQMGTTSS